MKKIEEFERVRDWAERRGIYEKGDVKTQFVKLSEEFGEVAKAIIQKDDKELKDGIGDMVVVLTNLAHLAGTTIEECIDLAWDEIKNRRGAMVNGSFVKEEQTVEAGDVVYKCIGLKEERVHFWASSFKIGKQYKLIKDKSSITDTLFLINDDGKPMFVDEDQFELLPF